MIFKTSHASFVTLTELLLFYYQMTCKCLDHYATNFLLGDSPERGYMLWPLIWEVTDKEVNCQNANRVSHIKKSNWPDDLTESWKKIYLYCCCCLFNVSVNPQRGENIMFFVHCACWLLFGASSCQLSGTYELAWPYSAKREVL